MSLLLMLNILKPEEQLATEYVKTTAVALSFWSQWHSAPLGCIHSEELGEAHLSRFSFHCRRNTACTIVQQSSNLFLTLPPVQPGETHMTNQPRVAKALCVCRSGAQIGKRVSS